MRSETLWTVMPSRSRISATISSACSEFVAEQVTSTTSRSCRDSATSSAETMPPADAMLVATRPITAGSTSVCSRIVMEYDALVAAARRFFWGLRVVGSSGPWSCPHPCAASSTVPVSAVEPVTTVTEIRGPASLVSRRTTLSVSQNIDEQQSPNPAQDPAQASDKLDRARPHRRRSGRARRDHVDPRHHRRLRRAEDLPDRVRRHRGPGRVDDDRLHAGPGERDPADRLGGRPVRHQAPLPAGRRPVHRRVRAVRHREHPRDARRSSGCSRASAAAC